MKTMPGSPRRVSQIGFAALFCLLAGGCMQPAMKAVQQPRAGRPLNHRLCIVYSQHYQISLGGFERLHPFDINKYAKIYLRLVRDGLIQPEDVFVPESISREDLLSVHTSHYLDTLQNPAALAGYLEFAPAALALPGVNDAIILQPFRHATGGTLLASRLALQYGMAVNLGGGYHHAGPETGGGFCVYADMPIAVRVLQAEGRIRRALIVDLDVHQGNGTALAFAGDKDVFTFDMHEEDIYPIPKEHCTLDVRLSAGTDDRMYLKLLKQHLPGVFDRARPDIVFLQAGVDPLAVDSLAHLKMTPEGIVQRDGLVFAAAASRKIPVVMVLGGGYSKDAWYTQYLSIRRTIETYGRSLSSRPGRQIRGSG